MTGHVTQHRKNAVANHTSPTSPNQAKRARRKNRPSPRERLLHSATQLFTTEGIRVIGIDRILREADVAKASLYSLFGSKDALVVAYLQLLDHQWREDWEHKTQDMTEPQDKILVFFDKMIADQPDMNYRGSHFYHAASEYPKPETETEHAIINQALEHRHWIFSTMCSLLEEKNGYPSHSIAGTIMIYFDGGIVGAQMTRSVEPLVIAREMTRQILSAPAADYSI